MLFVLNDIWVDETVKMLFSPIVCTPPIPLWVGRIWRPRRIACQAARYRRQRWTYSVINIVKFEQHLCIHPQALPRCVLSARAPWLASLGFAWAVFGYVTQRAAAGPTVTVTRRYNASARSLRSVLAAVLYALTTRLTAAQTSTMKACKRTRSPPLCLQPALPASYLTAPPDSPADPLAALGAALMLSACAPPSSVGETKTCDPTRSLPIELELELVLDMVRAERRLQQSALDRVLSAAASAVEDDEDTVSVSSQCSTSAPAFGVRKRRERPPSVPVIEHLWRLDRPASLSVTSPPLGRITKRRARTRTWPSYTPTTLILTRAPLSFRLQFVLRLTNKVCHTSAGTRGRTEAKLYQHSETMQLAHRFALYWQPASDYSRLISIENSHWTFVCIIKLWH